MVKQVNERQIRKAAEKHETTNMGLYDVNILTYVWVLKKSDGALVQTLSPSNPITLLQMFIFGSNGLFAITISPLKRKHKYNHLICNNLGCIYSQKSKISCILDVLCIVLIPTWLQSPVFVMIPLTGTYFCILQSWRVILSEKTISWLTIVGSIDGPEHWSKTTKKNNYFL